MAIGWTNQDSSFFDIDTVPPSKIKEGFNDRIMSFSVTEEMNTIFNGSLQLYDPYFSAIDKVLRMGKQIEIGWGYKKPDVSLLALFSRKSNPTEISGPFSRMGLRAYVSNVSGAGSAGGEITYSCNFFGSAWNSGGNRQVYSEKTRADMITTVLTRMKVSKTFINFTRGNEQLSTKNQVVQNESDFGFLRRMALYHGAQFNIGYGKAGAVAVFANWGSEELSKFASAVGSGVGSSITLDYKDGAPNVENYSFQQSAGDETGDSAQITMVGGQCIVKRFKANELTVTDYKLNMSKIQTDVRAKNAKGGLQAFVASLMEKSNIEELYKLGYFTKGISTTAPQGYGWQVKVRMLGNALVTAPMKVVFGVGFPSIISGGNVAGATQGGLGSQRQKTNFWVRSVTHTVDQNGYHMDLDIVDALTLTGGSYVS